MCVYSYICVYVYTVILSQALILLFLINSLLSGITMFLAFYFEIFLDVWENNCKDKIELFHTLHPAFCFINILHSHDKFIKTKTSTSVLDH